MLKPNTVFILGAGVSAEVGMPLGSGLKSRIIDLLPTSDGGGDDMVRDTLFKGGLPLMEKRSRATQTLRAALPITASIDNLVEHLGADADFKFCAKVGIAAAILRAEQQSWFLKPHPKDPTWSVHDTTYGELFRLIVGNVPVENLEIAFRRVTVINFNYDRTLEHYVYEALQAHSRLTPEQAARVAAHLTVHRPYGSPAQLPWQSGDDPLRFGVDLRDTPHLADIAMRIRTFSEERGSDEDIAIRASLAEASQVVFLGCAFHPQNMRLLRPERRRFPRAYGTCYALPAADKHSIPSIESYAAPLGDAFRREVTNWPRPDGGLADSGHVFEPLTSLQFVRKYMHEWTA